MSAELSSALNGALLAFVGVVTAVIAVIGVHLPKLISAWFEARTEATRTQRAQRLERASDQAVAAAEEVGRAKGLRGEEKLSLATEAAQELALGTPTSAAAIQAAVAKLRTSTSSSQLQPVQLPVGAALSIPVTVVSSEPPPLPRPAATGFRSDAPTKPEGSRR